MNRAEAITATPAQLVRITGLAVALALAPAVGMGFVSGRLTAPPPVHGAPTPGGIHYQHGVPRGFPLNPQGAGDAAAWYVTLLSAHAQAPQHQLQALIAKLTVPAARRRVTAALTPHEDEPTGGRPQYMPLRVWAAGAHNPHPKPEGATVSVELYKLAVPATHRDPDRDDPGSGFCLQRILMQRHHGEWLLRRIAPPVTAPGPLAGPAANRESATLARVLGSDSWVPYMR